VSSLARLSLIAVFTVAALVCLRLGIWQLSRLRERRAANAVASQAREAPPVQLDAQSTGNTSLIDRHVTATGRYDHAREILLRGRVYQGVPGVEVITPLVFQGGRTAVLVNRGFVPAPDAMTAELDSLRELGEVKVEGVALPVPSGDGVPLERSGRTTWGRLDLDALSTRLPYTIAPVYVRQSPASSLGRFPRRLEPPSIDDGPHLNYAIQWFAFAVMAVVFGVVIMRQSNQRKESVILSEAKEPKP
jgi:surfeit locus 1 family protein